MAEYAINVKIQGYEKDIKKLAKEYELEKNKIEGDLIRVRVGADKKELENVQQMIENFSKEQLSKIVLSVDSTSLLNQLNSMESYMGKTGKEAGNIFKQNIQKSFKALSWEQLLEKNLGSDKRKWRNEAEQINIIKGIQGAINPNIDYGAANITDIMKQAEAYEQLLSVVQELHGQKILSRAGIDSNSIIEEIANEYTRIGTMLSTGDNVQRFKDELTKTFSAIENNIKTFADSLMVTFKSIGTGMTGTGTGNGNGDGTGIGGEINEEMQKLNEDLDKAQKKLEEAKKKLEEIKNTKKEIKVKDYDKDLTREQRNSLKDSFKEQIDKMTEDLSKIEDLKKITKKQAQEYSDLVETYQNLGGENGKLKNSDEVNRLISELGDLYNINPKPIRKFEFIDTDALNAQINIVNQLTQSIEELNKKKEEMMKNQGGGSGNETGEGSGSGKGGQKDGDKGDGEDGTTVPVHPDSTKFMEELKEQLSGQSVDIEVKPVTDDFLTKVKDAVKDGVDIDVNVNNINTNKDTETKVNTGDKIKRSGDRISLTGYHGTRFKWNDNTFDVNRMFPAQLGSGMYFVDSLEKLKGFMTRPGSQDIKKTQLELEKAFILTNDYISSFEDINKILGTTFTKDSSAKEILSSIRNYAKDNKENSMDFRKKMLSLGYQGMYVGDNLANKNIKDEIVVYDDSLLKNLQNISKDNFQQLLENEKEISTVIITLKKDIQDVNNETTGNESTATGSTLDIDYEDISKKIKDAISSGGPYPIELDPQTDDFITKIKEAVKNGVNVDLNIDNVNTNATATSKDVNDENTNSGGNNSSILDIDYNDISKKIKDAISLGGPYPIELDPQADDFITKIKEDLQETIQILVNPELGEMQKEEPKEEKHEGKKLDKPQTEKQEQKTESNEGNVDNNADDLEKKFIRLNNAINAYIDNQNKIKSANFRIINSDIESGKYKGTPQLVNTDDIRQGSTTKSSIQKLLKKYLEYKKEVESGIDIFGDSLSQEQLELSKGLMLSTFDKLSSYVYAYKDVDEAAKIFGKTNADVFAQVQENIERAKIAAEAFESQIAIGDRVRFALSDYGIDKMTLGNFWDLEKAIESGGIEAFAEKVKELFGVEIPTSVEKARESISGFATQTSSDNGVNIGNESPILSGETHIDTLYDELIRLRDLKKELARIDLDSEDGVDQGYSLMYQIQELENKLHELYSYNKDHHIIDAESTIDDISRIENKLMHGTILTMFRGTDNPDNPILSKGEHGGGTFFTDDIDSAKYYGENGKLYQAKLMIKDALEFIPDVNSMVDAVTFTGNGTDDVSTRLKAAIDFVEQSGHSLYDFRNILMERYSEFRDGNDFVIPFNSLDEQLKNALITIKTISEDTNNIYGVYRTTDTFAEKARINGYDSLIIHDISEAFNQIGEEIKSTIAVIFDKNQLLSHIEIKPDDVHEREAKTTEGENTTSSGQSDNQNISDRFNQELSVVENVIEAEKQLLTELSSSIEKVTESVDMKTNAFREEGEVVTGVTQEEISSLTALDGWVTMIAQDLRELANQLQNLPEIELKMKSGTEGESIFDENLKTKLANLKEVFNNLSADTAKAFADSINSIKFSSKNIENLDALSESIQKLGDTIKTLNGSETDGGMLSYIKEILQQADALKDFASILSESDDKIKKATEVADKNKKPEYDKAEMERRAAEIEKEIQNIISGLQDEVVLSLENMYDSKGVLKEQLLTTMKKVIDDSGNEVDQITKYNVHWDAHGNELYSSYMEKNDYTKTEKEYETYLKNQASIYEKLSREQEKRGLTQDEADQLNAATIALQELNKQRQAGIALTQAQEDALQRMRITDDKIAQQRQDQQDKELVKKEIENYKSLVSQLGKSDSFYELEGMSANIEAAEKALENLVKRGILAQEQVDKLTQSFKDMKEATSNKLTNEAFKQNEQVDNQIKADQEAKVKEDVKAYKELMDVIHQAGDLRSNLNKLESEAVFDDSIRETNEYKETLEQLIETFKKITTLIKEFKQNHNIPESEDPNKLLDELQKASLGSAKSRDMLDNAKRKAENEKLEQNVSQYEKYSMKEAKGETLTQEERKEYDAATAALNELIQKKKQNIALTKQEEDAISARATADANKKEVEDARNIKETAAALKEYVDALNKLRQAEKDVQNNPTNIDFKNTKQAQEKARDEAKTRLDAARKKSDLTNSQLGRMYKAEAELKIAQDKTLNYEAASGTVFSSKDVKSAQDLIDMYIKLQKQAKLYYSLLEKEASEDITEGQRESLEKLKIQFAEALDFDTIKSSISKFGQDAVDIIDQVQKDFKTNIDNIKDAFQSDRGTKYGKAIARLNMKDDTTEEYKNKLEELINKVKELNSIEINPEVNDGRIKKLREVIDATIKDLSTNKGYVNANQAHAQSLRTDISQWISNNTAALTRFGPQIKEIQDNLNRVSTKGTEADIDKVSEAFERLKQAAADAGATGESFGDKIRHKIRDFSGYLMTYVGFQDIVRYAREAIDTIVQLDTALVDLKKTANMSSDEMQRFYLDANDAAKEYGVTTAEIIQQAADWSRLGYNTADSATNMAKLSSQFAAISPGMDVETATTGLVSIMKAYDIDVNNVLDGIESKINAVGNSFATSNDQILTGLQKSSSALAAANNSFDESIALFTAGQEILQNAEVMGQSLKTISMRLRGYDEETEEISEDLVNISGVIADLTKTEKSPGGVSLFTDQTQTEYRTTYDILKDISEVWDDLTDANQAKLLEKLFGKTRANLRPDMQKYML